MLREEELVRHIEQALKSLGNYFSSPDELRDTANRVARVWIEMTDGSRQSAPKLKWFPTKFEGLLIKGPIEGYFLCPHHLLPVVIKVFIGLVPNGYVLGISKITRTILWACKRLALQEDITQLIADRLWDVPESYKPVGLIVRVIGDHFCEKIRGVKRQSPTITTQVRGFIREEFLTMFYKHIKEWA